MSQYIFMSLIILNILSGQALFAAEPPQWKPGADSTFEVGTQLRPWTIRDEGMDYILDNCRSMAGVNNIYLIVVMHQEHRPYQAKKFPHNPARGTFMAEDSTVAFFPEMSRYGKIKPQLSSYQWIRETDWLKLTVDACRKRGLGVGTEISHFPIPKGMLGDNPGWLQRDVAGNIRSRVNFCPNNPDVRHYLRAIFGDLAANYDLDYIQTCQYLFPRRDIDQGGGCFCSHCNAAAEKMGIDLIAVAAALRKDKNAKPYRERWREFQFRTSTEVYRELAQTIRNENPKCHLRLNDVYSWRNNDPRDMGLDLTAICHHLGSMVHQDHQEQLGLADEDFSARKKWLTDNREHLGPDKPLLTGIAPRMRATPELVREGIRVAVQHPAAIDGLALKHYDGASFSLLRAFKQGMIEAGVQGLSPTLGKEVESMELDGYEPFDKELAEEWGVKTSGTGRASFTFDLPTGTYDIRITYFDGPDGHSDITLSVAGSEKASFKMDEDCDCWRWQRFEKIQIRKGDRLTLTGKADGKEEARLDFIELIKK